MKAELLRLGTSDLIKGFLLSIITVVLTSLLSSLELGTIPTDFAFWRTEAILGLSAGISYLVKNLLTNSKDEFLKKENKG